MKDIQLYDQKKLLAEQMTRLRKYEDLSQSKLAERAGISLKTVQNIEECRPINPRLNTVINICHILKMDPRYFVYPELLTESPYIGEMTELLSDCSNVESEQLLRLLREIKKAMRLSSVATASTMD